MKVKSTKLEPITVTVSLTVSIGIGILLHFLYELSSKNSFAAVFSAVNESVWEHLKLIYMPFILTMAAEYIIYGISRKHFFFSKLCGVVIGMLTTVILFYTYTGICGYSIEAVNIIIYLLSLLASYGSALILMNSLKWRLDIIETISIFLIGILFALFFVFTFLPPKIPIFRDPTDMSYGI